MTAPRIKSLTARQAEKITIRSLNLMNSNNSKLNSTLARQFLLNSTDAKVIVHMKNYFFERVYKGKDKRALDFLIKYSSEKNNPNILSRRFILAGLGELARYGEERTIPGLIRGAKSEDKNDQAWAFSGLRELKDKRSLKAKDALKRLEE